LGDLLPLPSPWCSKRKACVLPCNLDKNEPKDGLWLWPPLAPKADAAKKASPAWQRLRRNLQLPSAPAAEPARAASPRSEPPPKFLTTAEVIAAELRLSQENSPPPVDGHLLRGTA